MSRFVKILFGTLLIVFILACNVLTQPVRDVQDVVSTAESLATAMPVTTLQALPSALPDFETALPDIQTAMPDLGGLANPQGAPLSEWNGIPIIPSATAGEESTGMYSFKADTTTEDVTNYYKDEMVKLGWNEFFVMPDTGSGALLTYEKDSHLASITITSTGDGTVLVFLTYQ